MNELTMLKSRLALLLVALVLGTAQSQCHPYRLQGQSLVQIAGQGKANPGVTLVGIDAYVDSISSINSQSNSFKAVLWIHLSWSDNRVQQQILTDTRNNLAQNKTCSKACDASARTVSGCCDSVWLPNLELPNLVSTDSSTVQQYRIWLSDPPNSADMSTVHWSVRLAGDFKSRLNFRHFPFDSQNLLFEVQVSQDMADRVVLVPNDFSYLRVTPHGQGDVLPGWSLGGLKKHVFDTTSCMRAMGNAFSRVTMGQVGGHLMVHGYNPGDAAFAAVQALDGGVPAGIKDNLVTAQDCNAGRSGPGSGSGVAMAGPYVFPESLGLYSPYVVVFNVMVKRQISYHLTTQVFPLLMFTCMAFIAFALDRHNFPARLAVVGAIALCITTLRLAWDSQAGVTFNAVHQLLFGSYGLLMSIALEALFIMMLLRHASNKRAQEQASQRPDVKALQKDLDLQQSPTISIRPREQSQGRPARSKSSKGGFNSKSSKSNLPDLTDQSDSYDVISMPDGNSRSTTTYVKGDRTSNTTSAFGSNGSSANRTPRTEDQDDGVPKLPVSRPASPPSSPEDNVKDKPANKLNRRGNAATPPPDPVEISPFSRPNGGNSGKDTSPRVAGGGVSTFRRGLQENPMKQMGGSDYGSGYESHTAGGGGRQSDLEAALVPTQSSGRGLFGLTSSGNQSAERSMNKGWSFMRRDWSIRRGAPNNKKEDDFVPADDCGPRPLSKGMSILRRDWSIMRRAAGSQVMVSPKSTAATPAKPTQKKEPVVRDADYFEKLACKTDKLCCISFAIHYAISIIAVIAWNVVAGRRSPEIFG